MDQKVKVDEEAQREEIFVPDQKEKAEDSKDAQKSYYINVTLIDGTEFNFETEECVEPSAEKIDDVLRIIDSDGLTEFNWRNVSHVTYRYE